MGSDKCFKKVCSLFKRFLGFWACREEQRSQIKPVDNNNNRWTEPPLHSLLLITDILRAAIPPCVPLPVSLSKIDTTKWEDMWTREPNLREWNSCVFLLSWETVDYWTSSIDFAFCGTWKGLLERMWECTWYYSAHSIPSPLDRLRLTAVVMAWHLKHITHITGVAKGSMSPIVIYSESSFHFKLHLKAVHWSRPVSSSNTVHLWCRHPSGIAHSSHH